MDLGGGNGYVTRALCDMGLDVFLVEPGIRSCRNAQKRGIKNIICATIENLTFTDQKVQSIGIFDVLEHIPSEEDFLSVLHRALDDKGKLYLTVPAYSSLWSSADDAAGHYRRYSIVDLQQVLLKNRFKIVYASYFFSHLVLPVFLFRRIPYLLEGKHRKPAVLNLKMVHTFSHSPLAYVFRQLSNIEASRLQKSVVPYGTSIIAVAEKA